MEAQKKADFGYAYEKNDAHRYVCSNFKTLVKFFVCRRVLLRQHKAQMKRKSKQIQEALVL